MKYARVRAAITAGLAAVAALAVSLPAAPASAATPANPACLGKDLSTYARWDGPHGSLVSWLAHTNGGLGPLVQTHQAGLIPDSVIDNSCND